MENVLLLLLARDFTLNDEVAREAEIEEFRDEAIEVDEAISEAHLVSEIVGISGAAAILGMDALDIGTKDIEGIDGIAASVEEEVGGIEIDAEIVETRGLDVAQQGHRRLLPSLKPEANAELFAVATNVGERFDYAREKRIGHVFGQEATVRDKRGRAELCRKVGPLLELLDTISAELWRDDAERGGAFREVPCDGTRVATPEGGEADLVLIKEGTRVPEGFRGAVVGVPTANLDAGKPKFADGTDKVGVWMKTCNDANGHG